MSFTTNTSNVTGKSTTNAFNIVANSITVNKNELVKGDLTVLGNTNIGNVTLETANVDYLTVNHFTATNPVPTTSGGTGLSTIGTAGQVLQVNLAGNGLTYGTAALTNPSTITGNGFTGTPTYSMGIESTGTGTDGRGFVRTSSQAFGLDIQTSGTGKYIKLESDTVSIPQTTTPSTSTSTGALVVTGDVGIGGKVNLAGNLNSYSTTSQFVNVSDTVNLGPFGFPVSYLTAAGRISMNGVLSLPAPNPFTDNSQLAFQPATGSFVAFGYPSYNLTLSSGTASTTIGPSSSPTSFGISAAIQNTVYSFSNTLVGVPVPVPAVIENTTIGFQAGTAFGGYCKTYLRTDNLSGAQLIDINAQGGSGGIGTIGNVNIFASGGLVGSQIRIATLGANTSGVLINPGSGGVNLSPSAGGVTANPTAGGILLQAKDTSNINIQTGTAFYPSPSASGSVIISSASGSVSIDASQQLFTVGYIAALPGSTSVPVGSNLCGAIALIASNNSAAYATGNIDLYTTATGVNTGPGNITLNTSNAYTGLMNFTSKGLITFEASSGADLVTIDPTNFQYRFHNSGGGHCLSIDRNAALFTFPTSTPAPISQGFIDVNVTNATSGCLLSIYASSLGINNSISKIWGRNTNTGNSIQEVFTYTGNGNWNNTYEMKFSNGPSFISVTNGIALPLAPFPQITLYSYDSLQVNFGSKSILFNGSNLTSSYTWKWPATMGTNGQVLVTDGSSQVYWQNTSSLGYVTGVTASSPLASSGGSAPNISISTTPTFNSVTFAAQNLADKTISAGTSYGLIFAANSPITASFRFCNSTGSTDYITVNEVYYMANINGVLGVTGNSAKLEVVNTITPIVAGNPINTGLFLTQYMNSTDQNVITIGKTQSGNGNCGQIYYTYDSTLTNCKFGLKFFSSSTSPTIEMQNNGRTTVTGNSSSYSSSVFSVVNTNTTPLFSAAILAPNMSDNTTTYFALGKSVGAETCALFSYVHYNTNTSRSSNWSMYNSNTYIQQYYNGNININTNTGSYTNITSTVTGGSINPLPSSSLLVTNNYTPTGGLDTVVNVGSFFAPQTNTQPLLAVGRSLSQYAFLSYTVVGTTKALNLSTSDSVNLISLQSDGIIRIEGVSTAILGSAVISNGCNVNSTNLASTTALNPALYVYKNVGYQYGVDLAYGTGIGGGYSTRIFCPNSASIVLAGCSLSPTSQSDFTNYFVLDGSNGNIQINNTKTVMTSSLSSYSDAPLMVYNTNTDPKSTLNVLAPNMVTDTYATINLGKAISLNQAFAMIFGKKSSDTSNTFTMLFAGSSNPQILFTAGGTIQLTATSIINSGTTYMSGDLNINTGGGAQTTFQFRGTASAGFLTNASGPQATLNCCSYIYSYPQYVTTLTSGNLMNFFAANGANQIGNINTNGSNCTFNSTSDSRLKTDISPATNMLQLINQLEPVSYKWKNNVDLPEEVGFIADDLQKIIPALTNGTPGEVDDKGNPVYMSVSYGNFSPYLVGAIQELYTEIQNLKAQIALLK